MSMNTAFTMPDTGFRIEFARFVDFVGPQNLREAISRVASKLARLSPALAQLYRDRYFFHQQCLSVADGPTPFQLDVSDIKAVRAATFIAGVNRIRHSLSAVAIPRFRSVILSGLKSDRDIRQLEHEVRSFIHFGQMGMVMTLADLEATGRFDLECRSIAGGVFEVECKTVTEDTGSSIKTDLFVNLSEEFRRALLGAPPPTDSGRFILTFRKHPEHCRNLAPLLRSALISKPFVQVHRGDFDLSFEQRPEWTALAAGVPPHEVRATVARELEGAGNRHIVTKVNNKIFALVLQSEEPNKLSDKVTSVLKRGADQCSGRRPALVWLHFIGHPEMEFLQLAEHSTQGQGLNVIVANILSPRASTNDRCHVHTVRFSAEAAGITRKPVLDSEHLLRKAGSLSGPCYDVPNPFCRFKDELDF
jgi:hypothetical protein